MSSVYIVGKNRPHGRSEEEVTRLKQRLQLTASSESDRFTADERERARLILHTVSWIEGATDADPAEMI